MGPSALHIRRLALATAAAACLLLAGAGGARAQTIDFLGSFGSGVQSGGHFADAEGIATDGAGRVYVVDSTADDVEIYDNAANGNRFLGLLSTVKFVKPTGIADRRPRPHLRGRRRHATRSRCSTPTAPACR